MSRTYLPHHTPRRSPFAHVALTRSTRTALHTAPASQSRQEYTGPGHTCHAYTVPSSPAHSRRLSHPRVSRPRLFFWKLCSPFPSPSAGSARCIFSLSGFRPFPPGQPARDLPPCAPRGTPAIPFPTVIPEGIPGFRRGHGFSRWLRGELGGVLP